MSSFLSVMNWIPAPPVKYVGLYEVFWLSMNSPQINLCLWFCSELKDRKGEQADG